MNKIITKNEFETMKLGEKLAKNLGCGTTIALEGDLGAGKTTLIKGIARGLGIKKNITSPTFVLMKIYDTNGDKLKTNNDKLQIKKMCHVDAYRIEGARGLVDIGILEYINDSETVTIIEWAEKVREILPKDAIWVRMKYGGDENQREIEVGDK